MENDFEARGIRIPSLAALPYNDNNASGKEEILNWFYNNPFDGPFVIIDDDRSLNDLPPTLKNRLVQTDSMIGLTEAHVDQVKAILSAA